MHVQILLSVLKLLWIATPLEFIYFYLFLISIVASFSPFTLTLAPLHHKDTLGKVSFLWYKTTSDGEAQVHEILEVWRILFIGILVIWNHIIVSKQMIIIKLKYVQIISITKEFLVWFGFFV